MAHIKIATLNINGLTSPIRVAMLADILRLQEFDILVIQEVTKPVLHDICGYTRYYNMGVSIRGRALLTRDGISLENVSLLPSGRAIAAQFRDIWIINIYAPSETARKQVRELY
jgi:exonuclease III